MDPIKAAIVILMVFMMNFLLFGIFTLPLWFFFAVPKVIRAVIVIGIIASVIELIMAKGIK